MALEAHLQKLDPGARVSLFRIDTTSVGGGIYYFTQNSDALGGSISFGRLTYHPVDITVSGFEVSAGGSLPTPTIQISNTNGEVQQLINGFGDLLGCQVQRIRTFARYLDGQPEADPTKYLGPDTFEIEQKVHESREYIEWQLSAAIDQDGKLLPGRVCVRDTCLWRYRSWNKAANRHDYSRAQCPFADARYFDKSGNATTPDKDVCGRRISDCELRFGKGAPLPFGGFPGSARVRG